MQVSVIIPVFNAVEYLHKAVESALAQPETGEVILVEDGSSDESLAICQQLAAQDPRVKLYRHQEGVNRGAASSWNLGIQRSRCAAVSFLHADAYYLPGRFGAPKAIFEASPDADGVFEAVGICSPAGETGQVRMMDQPDSPVHLDIEPEDLLAALAVGSGGAFELDGLTVRRRVFDKAGLYDEALPTAHETLFRIKLAAAHRLVPGQIRAPVAIVSPQATDRIGAGHSALQERFRAVVGSRRALRCWAPGVLDRPRSTLIELFIARCLAEALFYDPRRRSRPAKILKRIFLLGYAFGQPRLLRTSAYWQIILSVATPLLQLRVLLPGFLWQLWLSAQPLPRERVVMFHASRSGSTVLGDLLNQHPELSWRGEVALKVFTNLRASGLAKFAPAVKPARLLLSDMAGIRRRFYGCEIKPFHIERLSITPIEFIETLDRLGFRHFIILERKNSLKKIVSNIVALQQGRFEQPANQSPDLTRVVLHLDRVPDEGTTKPLLDVLRTHPTLLRRFRLLLAERKVLELTYEEDILEDPVTAYRRACAFLGIEPTPVDVRIGRSNPFKLAEIIENYAEVKQALHGTEFEWMLDE